LAGLERVANCWVYLGILMRRNRLIIARSSFFQRQYASGSMYNRTEHDDLSMKAK
jgi:hypothetical protein